MDTRVLNILLCGSNEASLQRMARFLNDEGVTIDMSCRLVECLGFLPRHWDFLIVDLDDANSFLRSLLPAFFKKYPDVYRIGVSSQSESPDAALALSLELEMDAYVSELPKVEELIVLFPEVAARYLCDKETADHVAAEPQPQADKPVKPNGEVPATSLRLNLGYKESPLAL